MFQLSTSPVFLYEAITSARRCQEYALRAILVLAMLVALGVGWLYGNQGRPGSLQTTRQYLAEVGENFYYGAAGIQLAMALLAAPAATAGAVCIDRARGWLAHMFVTQLTDAEIVLGKFFARFASVLTLVLAVLPVMALAGLLGGIIPEALIVLTIVTLAVSLLGCALAMALSVRASKTHEVLMVVFTFWSAWLLCVPIWAGMARSKVVSGPPDWLLKLNPFVLAYAPYVWPGYVDGKDVFFFAAGAVCISIGLIVFMIRVVRRDLPVPGRESERLRACRDWTKSHLFSWWPSPSLDGNPVLWREWHRNRPTRMARMVRNLFLVGTIAGTAIGVVGIMRTAEGPQLLEEISFLSVTFGLLILSATAPTTLTEERVRGSLDVLLTTPLPTHAIVLGKWWATYRRILPLVLVPAVAGLFVAVATPEWPAWVPLQLLKRYEPVTKYDRVLGGVLPSAFFLAHAAAATSFGLLLATCVRRTGRAVAMSVGGFVVASVGGVVAPLLVVRPLVEWWLVHVRTDNSDVIMVLSQTMIALSPMGSQTAPLDTLRFAQNGHRQFPWQLLCWELAFVAFVALFLLGLTLLTFNRCLGRMNESPELRLGHGREIATADLSIPAGPLADLPR
jgi:ABC-type transport system involved in multi-copper enzyme maturation permease subunit